MLIGLGVQRYRLSQYGAVCLSVVLRPPDALWRTDARTVTLPSSCSREAGTNEESRGGPGRRTPSASVQRRPAHRPMSHGRLGKLRPAESAGRKDQEEKHGLGSAFRHSVVPLSSWRAAPPGDALNVPSAERHSDAHPSVLERSTDSGGDASACMRVGQCCAARARIAGRRRPREAGGGAATPAREARADDGDRTRPSAWEADALPTELRPRGAQDSSVGAIFSPPVSGTKEARHGDRDRDQPGRHRRSRSSRRGRESSRTRATSIKEGFRLIGSGVDRGEPMCLPRAALHDGMEEHISGVILFDETIVYSVRRDAFPELLERRGIIPGSRSTRARSRSPAPGRDRHRGPRRAARTASAEYHELGARFTKWRTSNPDRHRRG